MEFNDSKEGIIRKYDDENDDDYGSISGVNYEYEEEYETTEEDDIIYDKEIER